MAEEPPTPFLSQEQLQAIEVMSIKHVPEGPGVDDLTLVEETEDDRRERERREKWQAAVAPRDYPENVEDVMEAVLRHRFAPQFANGQPHAERLRILGRQPSERFLERFSAEAVTFQVETTDRPGKSCEIYQWKMAPPERATCWLADHDSGSMQINAYSLIRKDERWNVEKVENVLFVCGSMESPAGTTHTPQAKPPLRMLLP